MFSACIFLQRKSILLRMLNCTPSACKYMRECSVLVEGDFMINIPLERFSRCVSVHACIISSNLKSEIRLQHFSNLIKKLAQYIQNYRNFVSCFQSSRFRVWFGLVRFEVLRRSKKEFRYYRKLINSICVRFNQVSLGSNSQVTWSSFDFAPYFSFISSRRSVPLHDIDQKPHVSHLINSGNFCG